MEVLLILLVLAFPVIAIIGLVIAIGARDRVANLETKFTAFQKFAATRPVVAPTVVAAAAATTPRPSTPPIPPAAIHPEPHAAETPDTPAPPPVAPAEPAPPAVAAATSVPAVSLPPPSVPPVQPAQPTISFEERLGTQWTVWVGGIALALGGFFLVRYSIEQGWFGPGTRIVLGGLLALALIAAGEWARRNENLSGVGGVPAAHIPSILTAAGTAIAYADIWAAYGLYGFIDAGAAFVLLGIVAVGTLAAALAHGPALAGLGLVGAYLTPLIVSTDKPNFWALYVYLAVVTAAAFGLARIRLWRRLAFTAVAFSVLWTLPGLDALRIIGPNAHLFHVIVGFALAAALIVSGLAFGPTAVPGRIDAVSSTALAAYLFGAMLIVLASRHDAVALIGFVLLVAATVAIAWRAEAATAAVPAAGVLVALVFLQYAVNISFDRLVMPSGALADAIPEPQFVFYGTHITLGIALAALFGGTGFLAQGRSTRADVPMLWAASAVFVPVAILIALYYRIYAFEQSLPFAGAALLLATLFAAATETLNRREPRPGLAGATAIFATGAVAALALALTMALEKGWLTVALALMVPGIAFIADKRPLPALRVLTGILVALVLARIAYEPRIVGSNVGTTPIFNWLLWGYGIPAAAFWLGGYILRRRADDPPARMADSAALLFAVLLAFFEVRHYMTGGNIYRSTSSLAEVALHVNVGLATTIGLEWLRARTRSVIHNIGGQVIGALTVAGIILGLMIAVNPMVWPRNIGGPFINLILLGYGMPAALTAALALLVRGRRPQGYSQGLAVLAVALALLYFSFEVRTMFHGPVLTAGGTSNAELYTYSAVWLTFGVLLLALGIALRSQAVRYASAAVVIVTVLKVFLIDMNGLSGIWQSLSFIGLGIVLIGIGWFYQRLLFPRRPIPPAAPPAAVPAHPG